MPEGVKSRGCYLWTCPGKCLFLELGLRRDLTEVKSGLVLFELDMVCAGWGNLCLVQETLLHEMAAFWQKKG